MMNQIEAVQESIQETARSMAGRWNEEIQPSIDEVLALRRWDVVQKFKAFEKTRKMMTEARTGSLKQGRPGGAEHDGEDEEAKVICVILMLILKRMKRATMTNFSRITTMKGASTGPRAGG